MRMSIYKTRKKKLSSHIDRFRILKFKIFPCRKNLFPFYQNIYQILL